MVLTSTKRELNKMKNIIASYPAYDVIEATMNKDGVKSLRANTELALRNERSDGHNHLNHYMISSVVSSAVGDNQDPIKALERAKANGHKLHFIFALGTCLTAHKQAKKEYIEVTHGDRIYFEGRLFEIQPANNDNLCLKEIPSDGYSLMTIREIA